MSSPPAEEVNEGAGAHEEPQCLEWAVVHSETGLSQGTGSIAKSNLST